MDHAQDALLRSFVERLSSYTRETFRVDLSLAGGEALDEGCICGLQPKGRPAGAACRSFAESLLTTPTPRARCPEGLSVVVRPVTLPPSERLLLASRGFLEEGSRTAAAPPAGVATLTPGQVSLLEGFVDMGAALLAGLVRVAGTDVPDEVREEAWRDLLGSPTIVGVSPGVRALREALPAAANSPEPLFIDGEPGSGRQLLAAAVHRLGPRAGRPFIAEMLAALPEALQESEIFGTNGVPGLIAEAEGGTLYLAGVERLTPRCQELLQALLTRGGGPRIIASADGDLEEAARRGRFRRDLAQRLRTHVAAVPPLRERPEDIPLIAEHLVRRRAAASGTAAPALAPETLEALRAYPWAGNMRELDEELMRAAAGRSSLRPEDFSGLRSRAGRAAGGPAGAPLRRAVGELEVTLIEQTLAETNWNKSRAARTLGLSRLGLQKKIDRYGIDRRR
jgi:DNA-binding NtrC family response regulator